MTPHMYSYTKADVELLLVAQRSLLGEIPPRLRAVSFELSADGKNLVARFEFDGLPTEDEIECARVAMTNFTSASGLGSGSYSEEFAATPYPEKLKLLRLMAFRRNEDQWNPWVHTFGQPK
jgi:hypothetical protein